LNELQLQIDRYKTYFQPCFVTAFRILKDKMWAEDIVHDVFLSYYDNLKNNKSILNELAWLRKCTANACINAFRKKHHLELSAESVIISEQEESNFEGVALEKILEAINKLPHGYRIITELILLDQWSHDEVGELLGISASTSRSQLTRARKILQEKLSDYVR
jgi:RNA polymerase sigma factor (sigma-70 family)